MTRENAEREFQSARPTRGATVYGAVAAKPTASQRQGGAGRRQEQSARTRAEICGRARTSSRTAAEDHSVLSHTSLPGVEERGPASRSSRCVRGDVAFIGCQIPTAPAEISCDFFGGGAVFLAPPSRSSCTPLKTRREISANIGSYSDGKPTHRAVVAVSAAKPATAGPRSKITPTWVES
jgi:hypothetical protein